jgi:hypothetical protein
MTLAWHPHREPLRATISRTVLIAIVAGTVLTGWSARTARPIAWPIAVVLMLWITFGGHWVELWYLNWLRPRVSGAPSVQRAARLGTWFVGGCVLGIGMVLTARALAGTPRTRWPAWWVGGALFIGVELVAHTVLQARGRPSVFNGRG